MKILAFDSTARIASVALLEDGKVLSLYNVDNGLTQSELLLPMAEAMLSSLRLSFSDIDLFAATVGPGSFTGVRIGTALVKGLAFGRNLPCASVSTLEALAYNLLGLSGIAVSCMDARRGQVYCAIFRLKDERAERLSEDLAISLSQLSELLLDYKEEKIFLVGDGYDLTYKALSDMGLSLEITPPLLRLQSAASVGILAKEKYDAGECVSDTNFNPKYLRLPQAERERLEKEKGLI